MWKIESLILQLLLCHAKGYTSRYMNYPEGKKVLPCHLCVPTCHSHLAILLMTLGSHQPPKTDVANTFFLPCKRVILSFHF